MSISGPQDPYIVKKIDSKDRFDSRNCPDLMKAARCFSFLGGRGEVVLLGWNEKKGDYKKLDPEKEFTGDLKVIAFGEDED